MLSSEQVQALVRAAARAPSADNVQAWRFAALDDGIALSIEPSRMLPTDVRGMFGQIGLGAAAESLVLAASELGLGAVVEPGPVVRLSSGGLADPLAAGLGSRCTHRGAFAAEPLPEELIAALSASVEPLGVGVHWLTQGLERVCAMDARSTWIRLEHPPLKDELLGVLRLSEAHMRSARWGLDFSSLGLPSALGRLASLLRLPWVHRLAVGLGLARLISRSLAVRLRQAGALCLICAPTSDDPGYQMAGRAMLRLWLAAEAQGLAVQPHGVLPQYLTKAEVEPQGFAPEQVRMLEAVRAEFEALFPGAEHPAMLLRVGRALEPEPAPSLRLPWQELMEHRP